MSTFTNAKTVSTLVKGCLIIMLLLAGHLSGMVRAATLPLGFSETQISGLTDPTAMAFAPDGRLFVCEQAGRLRIIKNGSLLPVPFVTINVDSSNERGLLGVTFDPDFANNHFVYVYYTSPTPATHNRVSRFTANNDIAVPNSEMPIIDLNNLSASFHNGGAIHFGPDGKLYIAVGENGNGANSQTLNNLLGKLLRINRDGTIPVDNPFFNSANGINRAIWALGLRNPYTFAFQPGTARLFINDVGQSTWEEINLGQAGANYGWPTCEGVCSNPAFVNPIYFYSHISGPVTGCAITGGAFYNPATSQFPPSFNGAYFFADFCGGWIKRLDPATAVETDFATNISSPVDLQVSADGSLYYLARGDNSVFRITFNGGVAPSITQQPASQTVAIGQTVTFAAAATGDAPLSFQWQRNEVNIAGATGTTYTIDSVSAQDNGSRFRVVVTNDAGSAISDNAILTVANGPQLQFSSANFNVHEGESLAVITLTRSGDLTAAASVDYATHPSSANDQSDYTTAIGTMRFEPQQNTTSFSVFITDDAYVEGAETVNLVLSNAVGAALGPQSTATLTIQDNDTTQPTTNPADDPQFYVRQHYIDFLNREPDPGGLAYWTNQIVSCGSDMRCVHNRRLAVSGAFFVEAEFQNTGFFVYRFYKATLERTPMFAEFIRDRTQLQDGPDLTTEKTNYAAAFVQRAEFLGAFPLQQNREQFIAALLLSVRNSSGLDLSSKTNELLSEYNAGTDQNDSRARVILKLIEYAEYRQAEFNAAFVLAEYFGFLRRDIDESGYAFWLDILNNSAPNSYLDMICGFVTSTEYQQRFSPVITRSNRDCGQ